MNQGKLEMVKQDIENYKTLVKEIKEEMFEDGSKTKLHGMSSELNSPITVHFSSLIPRMSTFTLAISCLTTSNLP